MATYTVKLGLIGLTAEALVEKGRMHVEKLTGNASFTLPANMLTDISTACDELEAANLQVINNGGKSDHLIRRQKMIALHALLKELAGYVQAQAGNDLEVLNSSGFEARKKASPIGVPAAPQNLRITTTKLANQLKARWDAVEGRIFYNVWMAAGDAQNPGPWTLVAQTSKNSYVAAGLDSGKHYAFKVNAVTTAGGGTESLVVSAKVA